ncbi:hypothetical protein WJ972_28685 [Achromobacter insuavis]
MRAELARRLAELEQSANQRLDSGLVPVAFQQYQAVAQAAAAAREVLAALPLDPRDGADAPPAAFSPESLGDAPWL